MSVPDGTAVLSLASSLTSPVDRLARVLSAGEVSSHAVVKALKSSGRLDTTLEITASSSKTL
ncbi:hypothetical protein KC19_1G210500 [Ceratodon purpureus]|uniref:Uncharacterized protein n=1 Tax=Ceratodon purpureus TaxID=3225 RepID=A0A8T0JB19_CERPU|nr:hypothetical protein KC19_1G210500 [Ceratodon purpureus]